MPEPLLPAVDPRQGQLLGQAVLEGSKSALGTAAGFGRARGNVADAELGQGPAVS
jgi:hypothetical protein